MRKIKLVMIFSIFCLIIAMAPTFAMDNDTAIGVQNDTIIGADYYFDANIESDTGTGSMYNPYKELDTKRIPDNSIVHLADGEYTLKGSKSYSNLSIIGENPTKTIVKYYDAVGFTSNGLITLKDVSFVDLRVNVNSNANLNAINTIFSGSSGSNSVIYSQSGPSTVTLDNCTFSQNSAKLGGAVYLNEGNLNIKNSLFTDNYAEDSGGAIYCDNVSVSISNTKFINNRALNDAGGAIYSLHSEIMAKKVEFINCSASFGGALTSLSSDLNLNNVIAKHNRAKYYGGAIFKMYTSFELSNSKFENNSALNGGALYADNVGDFRINSNNFVNNYASSTGGAVYSVLSESYYDITDKQLNNTFKNNNAESYRDVYQNINPNLNVGDNDYILLHYNSDYLGTLPERYDLRDYGYVTPARNQGKGGNCWSFSAMAALESSILKAVNVSYDLSEENMKNIASLYSDYGWSMETNVGGYDKMAIGYLTGWLGPVNESEDEYSGSSVLSPLLNALMHIQDIAFLTRDNYTDNDAIKKAIMEYGAVSTSVYWSSSYINNIKNYYYTGSSSANHAVAIVGWDDNYEASNFKTAPAGNGAWIIKNSWGTSGDNGFYYVSYYDTKFAQPGKYVSYALILNNTVKYDKNYQYDIPGRTDYFFNTSSVVWYKNKFTATDNEYLAAVSTYFEKDTNWDLSVYVNNALKLKQSGTANPLKKGDAFEVVFKITVKNDAGVPISESVSLNVEMYKQGISFISYDGKKWVDFYELEWEYPDHTYASQVACIKAFTVLNPIKTSIKLTLSNIKDTTADIMARVFDEYGNQVKYGKITFNVDGTSKTVDISGGVAKLANINVKTGINNYTAKFSAVGYDSSSNFVLLSTSRIDTNISLDILSDTNPFAFRATVVDKNNKPVGSGTVYFNVEGVNYPVAVKNGVANLDYSFKTFGVKNIYATYTDLYCYKTSNDDKSINLQGIGTEITVSVNGQYNPITITANVNDVNGNKVNHGNVIFKIDGLNYSVNVTNGVASLSHVFQRPGTNSIKAEYVDNDYVYKSSSCDKSVSVLLKSTSISLNLKSNDKVTNPVNIIATVTDKDNNPVKSGKVTFSLDGETKVVEVANGKASIGHVFKKTGLNDVVVNYVDLNYYDSSSNRISLNVAKIDVDLTVSVEKKFRDAKINLKFSKSIDEHIIVYVNNNRYLVKSSAGSAQIKLSNLDIGKYTVKTYVDSYIYNTNNKTASFEITPIHTNIVSQGAVFYLNNNMYYSVVLKDENGLVIPNVKVSLTINNKTVNKQTDSSGNASFKLDLSVGTFIANVAFDGNRYYIKSSLNKIITVKSTISLPAITKYTYGAVYTASLLDARGNVLKNKTVDVIIDDEVYKLSSGMNGDVNYIVNLTPDSYQITVTNPVTGEVKSQTINVVSRIGENKNLTMYYGAGSSYKVRVYDDNGNVASGVEVTFKINGKTYKKFTNSNGYASLKIDNSFNPKTYTVTATYKGYKVSNKVTVKPTLVCKNMNVKKSKTFKYTVKLLNNKGKILKGKYVKVKFKGKTYNAKTNSKGIATFKIKVNSKLGKFTITSSYGSAKISKKITVKK